MDNLPSFIGTPINVRGSKLFVNPGTGDVEDATLKDAKDSIEQFVSELKIDDITIKHRSKRDERGRYCFVLKHNGQKCEIMMPGIPIEQVKFSDPKTQNAWHYPRLYVDGGSWLWLYAVEIARETLLDLLDKEE